MAGIADVGRLAGVTPSVVSRVLNDDPTLRIRAETRRRVLAAAREFDYTPNHAARALRQSRVGTLGLAVHDISNPVYAPLVTGAQHAASAEGYVLMLADIPELARDQQTFSKVVGSGAIDGLLLLPAGDGADEKVEQAVNGRLPTMVLNERSLTLPSIGLADKQAAELAAKHLLDHGHRDIAVLTMDGEGHRAQQRTEGFTTALRSRGVDLPAHRVLVGGHTADAGATAMRSLLDGDPPTGVVSASVLSAVGAMAEAHRAGLRIPADLSIIGFHDVFFAEVLNPSLTVVRLPLRALAEFAVGRLGRIIESGDDGEGHLVIDDPEPELVERGSTGIPAPRVSV